MAQLYYFKGRGRAETTRWMLAANGIDFQNIPVETPQALAALRSDDWMNEIYPLWIGAHGVMITLRRMARSSSDICSGQYIEDLPQSTIACPDARQLRNNNVGHYVIL